MDSTEKKGEITTTQIVMIVVLIASFIIILYFIYRLGLGSTSASEICHNSVVLKATGKGIAGDLNCKTDYVCISGGDKCANMDSTTTIKVDPGNKTQIMKAIAGQLSNCWWMFGEGKLDYSNIGLGSGGDCALCSQIEFDKSILNKNPDLTYKDFYDYLAKAKKDDTQTYLHYLYGAFDAQELINSNNFLKSIAGSKLITSGDFGIATGFSETKIWFLHINKQIIPVTYVPTNQLSSGLKCSSYVTQA